MEHQPIGTRRMLRDGSVLEVMANPRTGVPFVVHHSMLSDTPFVRNGEYIGRKDKEVMLGITALVPSETKGEVNW